MQGWYWDYPKLAQAANWSDTLRLKAAALGSAGFTHIWYPPFAGNGNRSGGYDPRDLYIGQDNTQTSLGTKAQIKAMTDQMAGLGITPVADMVYNHRDAGAPETNPAVKDYVTTWASNPTTSPGSSCGGFRRPFPSDRYRMAIPIGGTTGLGAGNYYVKMRSRGHIFNGSIYTFHATTGRIGGSRWTPANNLPTGDVDVTADFTNSLAVVPGRNYRTQINSGTGNNDGDVDEFNVPITSADFNAAGDHLFLEAINPGGQYSDHLPIEIWYDPDGAGGVAAINLAPMNDPFGAAYKLEFQTYTNFNALPSGQGGMNWEGFRPHFNSASPTGWAQTTCLGPDWSMQSLDYFYDYDHNQPVTQQVLRDWTIWAYDYLQSRGLRVDAVKHFEPTFMAFIIRQMIAAGKTPNLVVGEWYGENLDELKNWVDAVNAHLTPAERASVPIKVFDFSLRAALKGALDRNEDPRQVYGSSLRDGRGMSGFNVVTFLNNHDFREEQNWWQNNAVVNKNRILGYAYLLTNNQLGVPTVFYPDYYGYPAHNTVYNGETVGFGWHPANAADRRGHKAEIDQLISVLKTYINGSSGVDYLNHYGFSNTPPSGNPSNWRATSNPTEPLATPNQALIYQLNESGSAGGREVVVAINFSDNPLKVDHAIVQRNGITTGTPFTDILSRSAFPQAQVDAQGRIYMQLPPKSYSVWIEGVPSPLPVRLASFTAKALPKSVRLNWQSVSEKNFKQYDLERSHNAREFQRIGSVAGRGTGQNGSVYNFEDQELPDNAQTLYYRLRMVDTDNTFIYSAVRSVSLHTRLIRIQLIPNPVSDTARLLIASPEEQASLIRLINAAGQVVYQRSQPLTEGLQTVPLDLSGLPAGLYQVTVSTQKQQWSEKLVKQ